MIELGAATCRLHRPRSARLGYRRAFTLLEILLVLAVLVGLAAIVVPSLFVFDTEYLRRGAEQVRGDWTKARVEAMTTGLIQVFRYEPETGEYIVQPWEGDDAALEASSTSSVTGGGSSATPGGFGATASPYAAPVGTGLGASSGISLEREPKQLPPGVKFVAAQVALDNRGAAVSSAIGANEAALPVLFYPDGTTSDALLQLRNDDGELITLRLRGLTGVIQVSPVEYQEDLVPTGPQGTSP